MRHPFSRRRCICEPLEARALLAAGALDPSFGGGDGKLVFDRSSHLGDVIALSGGKMLLAGGPATGVQGLVVTRLNPDGSLDTSFGGGDGVAVLPAQGGVGTGAIGLRPDGKIIAAGALDQVDGFVVGRFNADGTPDTSFGNGGTTFVAFDAFSVSSHDGFTNTSVSDLALTPGGAVVVAGISNQFDGATGDADSRFAVVRLTVDGRPDASFSGDGAATFLQRHDFGLGARGVAVQSDGRILLAGETLDGSATVPAVLRLTTAGVLDPSFSSDGVATLKSSAYSGRGVTLRGTDVAVVGAGKIVVGGSTEQSGGDQVNALFAARFNIDGSLDTSFGGRAAGALPGVAGVGVVAVGHGNSGDVAGEIAVADDRIYVAGLGRRASDTRGDTDFAIARFTLAGAPDSAFGDSGVVLTNFSDQPPAPQNPAASLADAATHLSSSGDGKLVVVGRAECDGLFNTAVARYLTTDSSTSAGTYEAEQAILRGPVVDRSHVGYTGTGFADFLHDFDDEIEFRPVVPADGAYTLQFRYANGSARTRHLNLFVNGREIMPQLDPALLAFPPTGSWSTWRTVSVTVQLKGGARNSVRLLAGGESGPNLDSLTVRPAQPVAVLQAEDAKRGGRAIVARSNPGYTGTGYVDFVSSAGDYVEWTFDAPGARSFTFTFRYANGGASDRPLELSVDGAPVAESRVSFAPTGSWSNWKTASITLGIDSARTFRIRLTAVGSSGPNIDSLIVS